MHRGFTVLELLLALVLGTALMATLWAALSLYLRSFDSGRTEIEQTQLVRALLRKIESDLVHAVPEPKRPPATPPTTGATSTLSSTTASLPADATNLSTSATSSGEPAGVPATPSASSSTSAQLSQSTPFPIDAAPDASLIGTLHQLRLRTCAPAVPEPDLVDSVRLVDEVVRHPDDLHTIYYWLAGAESPGATVAPTGESEFAGLLRFEGDWLRWTESATASGGSINRDTLSAEAGDELQAFQEGRLPAPVEGPANPRLVVASEVERIEFRYLDNGLWHESWNSAARGRLPLAVEIAMYLREPAPVAKNAQQAPSPTEYDIGSDSEVELPDYRLIVPLPTAHRPPRPAMTPGDPLQPSGSPFESGVAP